MTVHQRVAAAQQARADITIKGVNKRGKVVFKTVCLFRRTGGQAQNQSDNNGNQPESPGGQADEFCPVDHPE
jgi:hypothetical protein